MSGRVIPAAKVTAPKCAKCAAAASGSSKPRSAPDAAVACIPCAAYLCTRCDAKEHAAPDKAAHVRYPVRSLKSYIDFSVTRPGESHPRSHPACLGVPQNLTFDGAATAYDTFWRAVKRYPEQPCLGARTLRPDGSVGPYRFESYAVVGKRVTALAAALRSFGVEPKSRVGLYAANRPEWIIGEQATLANNGITVPLYDTLGPEAAEQIIQQATVSAVICGAEKVPSLIEIAAKCPHLTTVIVMPPQPFEAKPAAVRAPRVQQPSTLRVIGMLEAEQIGAGLVKDFKPVVPQPEDFVTFCYTSGTTGMPKGAMLTHSNLISDMCATNAHSPVPLIVEREVYISYLPLAHMFERLTMCAIIAHGGTIGFSRGNPLLLLEDVEELKPTAFAGVPRLYNRVYDKVMAMINSSGAVKRYLFHTAYNAKLANLQATGSVTHPLWDRLVFSKIAAKLGGRVRIMVTGSAPISDAVMQFLRICFSCNVAEGYGQTESTAASTLTIPGDNRSFGNVGIPLISNLVKLVDVPEMNYTSKDVVDGKPCPRGEVCFKGANVFRGYYMDPEKTKEALDDEGWLHSGDIGQFLPSGELKLIDRKKNIFKTAQGEYVAPEKIENIYQRCVYVAQSFVHGDGLESTLVGVIVPDEEELTAWARKNKIAFRDFAELVANPAVKPMIMREMEVVAKDAKLAGFEQVKAIHLTHEQFSVENELLTPTLKLKRNIAAKKFAPQIAAMYGKGEQAAAAPIQSKL